MTEKEWFCDSIREQETAMYALAYSIFKNHTDAEEAVCESVYRAYRCLSTLKSRHAFKTWILSIVHNTSVEMLRKSARETSLDPEEPLEIPEPNVDAVTRIALRDAVESLDQPYRTVVLLYYYQGCSTAQISKITGTGQMAVRQQLSRARKMLRELLKEDFNE